MLNQGETDYRVVCFSAFWGLLTKYVKPFHRSEEVSLLFQKEPGLLSREGRRTGYLHGELHQFYLTVSERRSWGGRGEKRCEDEC